MRDTRDHWSTVPYLVRVSRAARILDLPRSTLYRLIRLGLVASVRLPSPSTHQTDKGELIRIPVTELRRLVGLTSLSNPETD